LFLKVLINGKANLYYFKDSNIIRYFYNIENSNIEQLVYKKYLFSVSLKSNFVKRNNQFKQQLWTNLKCPTIKLSKIKNLNYTKKSLIKFFIAYNACNNSKIINYEIKQNKDLFNLTLRPRINNASLSINNSNTNSRNSDFGNNSSFGFGIEMEYIFHFNKNKWSVSIEPTYQIIRQKRRLM
jgi:hypothetical protein